MVGCSRTIVKVGVAGSGGEKVPSMDRFPMLLHHMREEAK
jgi:hypothetical protein